jgi:hypothetical protein
MRLDKKRNIFWLNAVIIPLFLLSFGGFFNFLLPQIFKERKGIHYSVEGPIEYYDSVRNNTVIEVDNTPVSNVFGYRLQVWNSGDCPLENLKLQSAFFTDNKNFQIFSINRDQKSQLHFGTLETGKKKAASKSLAYEVLNKGDKDTLAFLTNDNPKLEIISNSAGVDADPFLKSGTPFFDSTKSLLILLLSLWVFFIFLSQIYTLWFIRRKMDAFSNTTTDIHEERKQLQDFEDTADKKKTDLERKFDEMIKKHPSKKTE